MYYIHVAAYINAHTERHRPSGKWGSLGDLTSYTLHPSPMHITSCVSACVSMSNNVEKNVRRMGSMNLSMGEITHVTVIISDLCLKTHFRIPPTLAKLTNSRTGGNTQY